MDHVYVGKEEDEETAARWFRENGELIVIKHGKEGSRAYTKEGQRYRIDIAPVNAVKSTGGGDAYSSALIYGILSGKDIRTSLEMATTSASLAVACNSCSDAMVDLETLCKAISKAKSENGELVTIY